MFRQDGQRFRDDNGRRRRTRSLREGGPWDAVGIDGVHEASTNPALEAAMRPFLSELTIPQRDAVRAVYWEQLSEEDAAQALGIRLGSLQERLHGRADRRSRGALAKIKDALVAAVGPEAAYAEIRQWLTPGVVILPSGFEDRWMEARCLICNRYCAQYLPNGLGYEEARLLDDRH